MSDLLVWNELGNIYFRLGAYEEAIAVYEKLGFRRVGTMRRYERHGDGPWHDGVLMELLEEEWGQ